MPQVTDVLPTLRGTVCRKLRQIKGGKRKFARVVVMQFMY